MRSLLRILVRELFSEHPCTPAGGREPPRVAGRRRRRRALLGLYGPRDLRRGTAEDLVRTALALCRSGVRAGRGRRLEDDDSGREALRHGPFGRGRDLGRREPLRPQGRQVLPDPHRTFQGADLPLSPVVLCVERRPAGRALPSRRQASGRHAGGLRPQGPQPEQAACRGG